MGLKDGTLRSLVTNGIFSSINNLAHCVIHQMLQALDFLAAHGIVHRDVKPENILYTSLPESYYQFQLSDFGLCNRAVSAVTSVGSPLYMAPEIFQSGSQSHKVDVWSLFVTMIWTLDIEGFRQNSEQLKSIQHVHQAVSDAASKVEVIREMARTDPNKRASAAQMLVKCFGGEGLVTSKSQVPPLSTEKSEMWISGAYTQASTPQIRCRRGPSIRGGVRQVADRCRVRKARQVSQDQGRRQTPIIAKCRAKNISTKRSDFPRNTGLEDLAQGFCLRPRLEN